MLQVLGVKLVNSDRGLSVEVSCVEQDRLFVVVNESHGSLNREENVLRGRIVQFCVMKVHDSNGHYNQSITTQLDKTWELDSVLDRDLFNFNVANVGYSGVGRKEVWELHVFNDLQFAHVDEAYVTFFFIGRA